MSHKKRTASRAVLNASTRAAGLESIDPALDLGGGLSLADFRTSIENARTKQTAYNALLAQSDEANNELDAAEAELRDFTERMLSQVRGNQQLPPEKW